MLKLVYTPTIEINESDLVPGSKWRRKSDGAECVLRKRARPGTAWPWMLFIGDGSVYHRGMDDDMLAPDSMLSWLRRDFERVGESGKNIKRLNEIDQTHLFAYRGEVMRLTGEKTGESWKAIKINGCNDLHYLDPDQRVRDLGPIEIDDSVRGVG